MLTIGFALPKEIIKKIRTSGAATTTFKLTA